MFPAFSPDPLITMGSDRRKIDYEAEWRAVLEKQQTKSAKKSGKAVGVLCHPGCTPCCVHCARAVHASADCCVAVNKCHHGG